MQAELEALDAALGNPVRPVAAIVGGAKVSTKLELLGNLVGKVNVLVIGGAMANTFLAAQGNAVGKSLQEAEMHGTARDILRRRKTAGCEVLLPTDAVVARELKPSAATRDRAGGRGSRRRMILDVGPATVAALIAAPAAAEDPGLERPARRLRDAAVRCGHHGARARRWRRPPRRAALRSVAGGGDTVSALRHAGVIDKMSYVSTAGGAFLEWLEGKTLPGVAALADTR